MRIVDMPEEEGGSPQKEVLNTVVDSLRAVSCPVVCGFVDKAVSQNEYMLS